MYIPYAANAIDSRFERFLVYLSNMVMKLESVPWLWIKTHANNIFILQGENIADNGGLREAFLAYQKYIDRNGEEPRLPGLDQYSPQQIFFLSNANIWCGSITKEGLLNQVLTDPHSPGKFRVLVPMQNMEEFSSVWSCPVGSSMNPEKKCIVW